MRHGLVLVAMLASGASAQFDQFTWTLMGNPTGSGSVTPLVMHVTGPDGRSCDQGTTTWFETVLPHPATIMVVVDYDSLDSSGNSLDAPAWVVDGVTKTVELAPLITGWFDGSYDIEFEVLTGQPFGFGIWSSGCSGGPGMGEFKQLRVVPHEWTSIGLPIDPRAGPVAAGSTADRVGDLDGDGHADFMTGAPGPVNAVYVISGKDGSALFTLSGSGDLGASVAGTGDIDGDGTVDFVAGAPKEAPLLSGAAHAWSGSDGHELFVIKGSAPFKLGSVVAGPGDLNGDGLADVAVRWAKNGLQVRLVAGPDGRLLGSLGSPSTEEEFGADVAGVGDVDLDGVPDLLIGIPAKFWAGSGRAQLYSGASRALLLEIVGDNYDFGVDVSGAGDIDQDGQPDLLVGEPAAPGTAAPFGAVLAYSGAGGAELFRVDGSPGVPIEPGLAGGSDVTGDGEPDFLTTTGPVPPVLQVRSGPQGDVVLEIEGTAPQAVPSSPGDIAIVGDVDGAGPEDVALIGDDVRVYKALDSLGPPALEGSGHVAGGGPVELAIEDALPGAMALLVVGSTAAQVPLLGGVLQPQPDVILPLPIPAGGSVVLSSSWPQGLPQDSAVWLQAWIVDPAGPQGWTCTKGLIATQLGN